MICKIIINIIKNIPYNTQMEKPSKRNLFDDDDSDDNVPVAKAVPKEDEDEMYKPQPDQMEQVQIDNQPLTQETNDEYQPQVDAYEPDYVPAQEEYVPAQEQYVPAQ